MIAVLVYRPDLADAESHLEAVEVLALFQGRTEVEVQDWMERVHDARPDWQLSMEVATPRHDWPSIPTAPPPSNPDAQFTTLPNGNMRSLDGRIELVHAKPEYLIGWRVKIDGVELDTRLLSPTEAKEHALLAAGLA
jgi:hypothetical protein